MTEVLVCLFAVGTIYLGTQFIYATLTKVYALHEFEETLRYLASYVGAGGDNAPTVDPKRFEAKIRWGINEVLNRNVQLSEQLSRTKKALLEMVTDCRESAEHLEKEVSQGLLAGDFKHPKAERAEALAGCAQRLERVLRKLQT